MSHSPYLFWGRGENNSPIMADRRFELQERPMDGRDDEEDGVRQRKLGVLNEGSDLPGTNIRSGVEDHNVQLDISCICDDDDDDFIDGAHDRKNNDDAHDSKNDDDDLQEGARDETDYGSENEKYEEMAFMRTRGRTFRNNFRRLVRICCVLSVLSVCMNTPQTFIRIPALRYVTLVLDIFTACIFILEMGIKMTFRGLFHTQHSYFRSPGRLFELFMLICLVASIVLQIVEMTSSLDRQVSKYLIVSFVRIPRPLQLLRSYNMSGSRIKLPRNIVNMNAKKVGEITLYVVYCLLIFALLGGQLFGIMDFFCVKNGKNRSTVTYGDLTSPIRRCPLTGDDSHCPPDYKCTRLDFKNARIHDEYFNHILASFLTVYEAMSLEGWSFKMFEVMEVIPGGYAIGLIYFLLVIILMGMLGRNIFTAIITEVFGDVRVELDKVSQQVSAGVRTEKQDNLVLSKFEDVLALRTREEARLDISSMRHNILQFVDYKPFIAFIHIAVLVDAIIQAFLSHEVKVYKSFQIVFTILFDIECLLKIVGMGPMRYIKTSAFEGIVCVGSTCLLPLVYLEYRAYAMFQVVRLLRLPMKVGLLRLFVKRILGSLKKLGQFAMFTLVVLIISAGIFLQLFCGFGLKVSSNSTFISQETSFNTFPLSFKATFQIFMQEAWTEVLTNLLQVSTPGFDVLCYIFLLLFHLLAATMLVSMFVALILDNLDLEEKLKIVKQKKVAEGVLERTKKLPLRIRVFHWFKPQPKVVINKNIRGVDNAPVIRRTFAKTFLEPDPVGETTFPLSSFDNIDIDAGELKRASEHSIMEHEPLKLVDSLRKQSSVTQIMKQAHFKSTYINSSSSNSINSNNSIDNNNSNIVKKRKISDITPPTISRLTSRRPTDSVTFLSRAVKYNANRTKTDITNVKQEREEAQQKQEMQIKDIRENYPTFDKSMFVFSPRNKLRTFIHKIVHARYKHDSGDDLGAFSIDRLKMYFVTQTYLEWLMIAITWMSLLGMIVEFNRENIGLFCDPELLTVELIFIVASTIEVVLKVIADGLMFAPDALIRDFGDVLHLVIYIVNLIYVAWRPSMIKRFSGAYALLVLRCLRPIRLITQCLPLRKEVWQVVRGYKDLLKVIFLFFILLFSFASYGVQAFSNKLKKCNDPNINDEQSCVDFFEIQLANPSLIQNLNGTTLILVPRVWRNPRTFNFDDMGQALLVLLEMLSLEGWTEIRDTLEPIDRPWGMIYPHLYVSLAGLIGLTLVIGIIVSNYNESKGTALLTVEQKRWNDLKSKLKLTNCLRLPPRPLESKYRHALYDVLLGKWYSRLYYLLILINSVTLFFGQWHNSKHSDHIILALDVIGIICSLIFVVDTLIKFYTFSVKGYFVSWDNRLDFLLMLGGVTYIIAWSIPSCQHDRHGHFKDTWECDVSRRIAIAVFMLRFSTIAVKHNALRMLMLTIIMGLYKGFWTFGIMGIIIFTYAYIGIIFFGNVKRGLSLNDKVNFSDFKQAILLLIRIMTGEDWNSLMHDAMISKPYCSIDTEKNYWDSNCGNKPLAYIYFHSFTWIITYFLLNVLTGVVIDNFSVFYLSDQDSIMSHQDIQLFQGAWNVVDKGRKGFVNILRAKFCLRLVHEKLNLNQPMMLKRMFQEVERYDNNKVTFHNLLFIVAHRKINNMTKTLQIEERLKREEIDQVVLEEAASKVIKDFMYYICRKRSTWARPNLAKSMSVATTVYSMDDSEDSDEDLFPSVIKKPKKRTMSCKVPALKYTDVEDTRKKERKNIQSDFYSWWDDELADIHKPLENTV